MIIYEDEELIIPAGLAHSITEDDIVNNDTISVLITENGTTVLTPDSSHTGFSRVSIDTSINLATQDKTIDSSTEIQTISADEEYDALGQVTVRPYVLDTPKIVDSSTNPQEIIPANDGLSKVIVNPYVVSHLEVDSSTESQTRTGLFSTVTVNPYSLESKVIDVTENGTIEIVPETADGLSKVQITTDITYSSQAKSVDSSTEVQHIVPDSGFDGLSGVTVNPYTLDSVKTVDSSTNPQEVLPVNDGLSKVVINPYVLNPLEVDSSTATQEFTGQFSTVSVNPYTVEEKSITITENGAAHVVPTDSSTLSSVHINVIVQPISQEFTLDSSTVIQMVTPDSSHNAISQVTVNPYALDVKTVDSSTVAQVVESDVDGLKEVHINPFVLEDKVIDSSTVLQEFVPETGFGSVKVNPYALQEKSIAIVQKGIHTITADSSYNGLSTVVIDANTAPDLQSKTVDSSTNGQIVISDSNYDGLESVVVNPYTVEERTVYPSTDTQVITPAVKDAIKKVTVLPYTLETKTVRVEENGVITVNPHQDYNGIGEINIITNVLPSLQSKTVDSSTVMQHIVPDSSYDGLNGVYVTPYILEEKTITTSTVGTQEYYPTGNGFSKFTVINNTNPINNQDKTVTISMNNATTYISHSDGYTGLGLVTVKTEIPSDIHNQNKSIRLTGNGTVVVTADEGYSGIGQLSITTAVNPNLQAKVADSSTNSQVITPDYPYEYLSQVTVNPYILDNISVDASVNLQTFYPTHDGFSSFTVNAVQNLAPENIKEGITILGTQGTFKGGDLQERSINSSTNEQVITPGSNYYGLSKVTVAPYVLQSKTANSSTNTQTIEFDSSVNGLSSVTINPYVLDSKTVYPSIGQQVVTSDYDGLSSVTVKPVTAAIDPDIVPGNIRQGVEILGVVGTILPLVAQTKNYSVSMDSFSQVFYPDAGYNGITEFTFDATALVAQRNELYSRLSEL